MPVHLTARITWHDSANNGAICRDPLSNVACRGHDWIAAWFADQKNAQQEQDAATKEVARADYQARWKKKKAWYEANRYTS